MQTENIEFFTTESIQSSAKLARKFLEKTNLPQGIETETNDNLINILNIMIGNPVEFDKHCQYNIKLVGQQFQSRLNEIASNINAINTNLIFDTFALAFRFLRELELLMPGERHFEVNKIFNFVNKRISLFPEEQRQQLIFANYSMPANIMRDMLHNPNMRAVLDFEDTVKKSTELKKEWDSAESEREKRIEATEAKLSKLTTTYNFVGLVNGFQSLHKEKKDELKLAFTCTVLLGITLVAIPIFEIAYIVNRIETIEKIKLAAIFISPALIAIELFTLYYFRITLTQYKSIKAQLLQIDIRISLCQFIEAYSTYATEIKKNDPSALAKFESLIFSNLVSEDTKIPATFDGVEQLANVAKAIKGP